MQAINKIILGTVQFGLDYGINNTSGKPTQQEIDEILYTAHLSGVQYLDTAEAYGDAHQIIGQFHKKYPDKVFNVITKLPHRITESLDEKIEKYLHDLNVIQLEGLLFHSYETYRNNAMSMKLLNQYKKCGKVKYLGVSVYTNEQIADVMEDKHIDIIQLPFNLFDNVNLRGHIIKQAKNNNKLIHTRSTFLQGLFFSGISKKNKIVQSLYRELKYINQLSDESKLSIQNIALNYCLQQQNIDNVLIGVDNLKQLKQNLTDANCSLPEKMINNINLIKVSDFNLLNPSLWEQ